MRLFRARKNIPIIKMSDVVYKGQLFFINDYNELPGYVDDLKFKELYEELMFFNNYGNVQLVAKDRAVVADK